MINVTGLLVGFVTFFLIGIFHVIVIKAEYYFSKAVWPLFLAAGILLLAGSLFVGNNTVSTLAAILGITCLWSIKELFQQEKRVAKGWFPKNPKRGESANKEP